MNTLAPKPHPTAQVVALPRTPLCSPRASYRMGGSKPPEPQPARKHTESVWRFSGMLVPRIPQTPTPTVRIMPPESAQGVTDTAEDEALTEQSDDQFLAWLAGSDEFRTFAEE